MGGKNPFRVLGISDEAVEEFPLFELRELAFTNFRSRVRMYHPDTGSDPSKRKYDELMMAREEVEDLESCKYWIKRIQTQNTRNTEVGGPLRDAEAERKQLDSALVKSWLLRRPQVFASLRAGASLPKHWRGYSRVRKHRLRFTERTYSSLSHLTSVTLFGKNQAQYELFIEPDGRAYARSLVRTMFDSRGPCPEDVPRSWQYHSKQWYNSYYWRPIGEPKSIGRIVLIGSLQSDDYFYKATDDVLHNMGALERARYHLEFKRRVDAETLRFGQATAGEIPERRQFAEFTPAYLQQLMRYFTPELLGGYNTVALRIRKQTVRPMLLGELQAVVLCKQGS